MSAKIIRNLAVMLFLSVGGVYVVNAESRGVVNPFSVKCSCTVPVDSTCSCECIANDRTCTCFKSC
jgi:hypothetical protein